MGVLACKTYCNHPVTATYKETAKEINGYELVMEFHDNVGGIGIGKKPYFIIHGGGKQTPKSHIAFRTEDRAIVDAFYKAAIEAGGIDNGAPGIREKYHPNYYGAFVLDPDGHNVEVVCHEPETAAD